MDLLDDVIPEPQVMAGRRFAAEILETRIGDGVRWLTRPVPSLALTLEGIAGDGHSGFTRRAGGREPWYPRGAEMRSGRQVSIVSQEEMAEVAALLEIGTVDVAAIGANLVLRGVPRLSYLPAGTRLHFESGAALVVEGMNAPCRQAGSALAAANPGRPDLELGFVKAAKRRRGLVASVERAGEIAPGPVSIRVPEQWVWVG